MATPTTDHSHDLVVITGGARGIGRHLAAAFAAAGYTVVLTATDAARAQQAAGQVAAETGGRVHGLDADVTSSAAVARLRTDVEAVAGREHVRPRVLINNAGRIESSEGPVWEADPDSLQAVVDTDLLGPVLMVNAFAPVLLDTAQATATPARIIDLNSGSGATGSNAYAAYSAAKAALFRLADSVHHYGYDRGLRIFEMAPGVVHSDMTHSMPVHDGRSQWTDPAQVTGLALALADGGLDAWSGRYLRAGADDPEELAARTPVGDERRLVLGG